MATSQQDYSRNPSPGAPHNEPWPRLRYETTKHLWLILEYCVGGDLRSLLRTDRQLPEATILRFARDLAAALQYLHSRGTLHCDLAPANLLLDENGRVKLGGFSLSRRVGDAVANAPLSASQVRRPGVWCGEWKSGERAGQVGRRRIGDILCAAMSRPAIPTSIGLTVFPPFTFQALLLPSQCEECGRRGILLHCAGAAAGHGATQRRL